MRISDWISDVCSSDLSTNWNFMNDKLKRRLAGAALLLVAAFVVVSLLPTPEQAAHQAGVEVVTIPLHDVISTTPQPTATTALPQTLAATDDTPAPVDSTAASHGDHAGDGTAPQARKRPEERSVGKALADKGRYRGYRKPKKK